MQPQLFQSFFHAETTEILCPPHHGRLIKRLSDICIPDRVIITPDSPMTAKLPYLMLEHIESNTGKISFEATMNEANADEPEAQSTTFLFSEKHVLYGKLRPYLNKVALPNFKGRCTTELIPLLPYEGVSRRYLAWILRRPETVVFAMQSKTGGRMPRANIDELLRLAIEIPESIVEQERLADIIESRMNLIAKAKEACERQFNLLDQLTKRVLTDFPNL